MKNCRGVIEQYLRYQQKLILEKFQHNRLITQSKQQQQQQQQ